MTHEPLVFGPAAHLWSRTDLTPADVDVAEIYDGFSFNCVSWLEALGFCGLGEAPSFLAGGTEIALDGSLLLNTHGGQLSAGRTQGFGFLHEAVVQLRRRRGAPGRRGRGRSRDHGRGVPGRRHAAGQSPADAPPTAGERAQRSMSVGTVARP